MSSTAQPTTDLDALKGRLKTTWMTGNYDRFARPLEAGAREFYQRLGILAGARMLDVGCGAGQVALIAAKSGARVTGCDIATNWLEQARKRAAAEKLDIKFEEGDAEALPYPDASFDAVTSLAGAMFAPRPDRVAAELTRVCRPGGMIAMANWTPGGFIGQMFKTIAKYIAPGGMPSPVLWGDEPTVRERFSTGMAELRLTRRMYPFDYEFGPADVVAFFRENYGPTARAFAGLDGSGQAELQGDLTRLWSSGNKETSNARTHVDAEYLEVVGIRA